MKDPGKARQLAPWPHYADDEVAAVTRVLASGKVNYWTGTENREFEKEFATLCQSRYAIAVANGTVALQLALQAALITAIEADAGLTALIAGRVYDYVPAGPQYPFCRIGPMTAEPFEGDCIDGSEIRFAIHGFTRDYGRARAADLSAALIDLLGRTTLDLGSGITANLTATSWSVTEDTGEKGAWHTRINLTATTAQ